MRVSPSPACAGSASRLRLPAPGSGCGARRAAVCAPGAGVSEARRVQLRPRGPGVWFSRRRGAGLVGRPSLKPRGARGAAEPAGWAASPGAAGWRPGRALWHREDGGLRAVTRAPPRSRERFARPSQRTRPRPTPPSGLVPQPASGAVAPSSPSPLCVPLDGGHGKETPKGLSLDGIRI